MKRMIPYLLALIAVLNLIWLFAFNYKMPSFFSRFAASEARNTEKEALSPAEEEEVQAPETAAEESEAEQNTPQETVQQEAAAVQTPPGQTAGEAAEGTAEGTVGAVAGTGGTENETGETAAQTGETVSLEGERTCRPADGNTPNIRSGPGSDYGVLRMAAYDEVMIIRGEDEGGWLPIRTQDGLEGYIFTGMLIIDEEAQ